MFEQSINSVGPFLGKDVGELLCTRRVRDDVPPHCGLEGRLGCIFRNHVASGLLDQGIPCESWGGTE